MQRKIIHVDMDAFYASVEQRDNPALRGKPVIVAWHSRRSVVCAASYEARPFGVHSAMAAKRARALCPQAVFVPPHFDKYRQVSRQIHAIFANYTDAIEPLSLDEAYLDVTYASEPSATRIAKAVRQDILTTTHLTASAGVAPNKFLAKVASDWHKPNGMMVIPPAKVRDFLTGLEVKKIPGVGKVTQAKLAKRDVYTVEQLRKLPLELLAGEFGRWGQRLYELARGIDASPVKTHHEHVQISSEDTLENDLPLAQLTPYIEAMASKTWQALEAKPGKRAHTLTLKLKTRDFRILTRSLTPGTPPQNAHELAYLACALRKRISLPATTRYRLVGVGLSGLFDSNRQPYQKDLFAYVNHAKDASANTWDKS